MFNKIKTEYLNNATVYESKQSQFSKTGYQELTILAKLEQPHISLVDVATNEQLKNDIICYKDGEDEALNDVDDQKLLVT